MRTWHHALALTLMLLAAAPAPARQRIASPDEVLLEEEAEPTEFQPPVRGRRPVASPRAQRRAPAPMRLPPSDLGAGVVSEAPAPVPPAPTRRYGLPELVASAVAKNPELRGQGFAVNAASRQIQLANAQELPIATFKSVLRDTNNDKRYDPFGPGLQKLFSGITDSHAVLTGMTVALPILRGDRIAVPRRQAKLQRDVELQKRERLYQEVIYRLIDIYLDLLLEGKRLALARQKLAKKEEDVKVARQRVKNEVTLRQQVLSAELEMDEIRQEQLEIENNLVLLRERLTRTAGIASDAPFDLEPSVPMKELEMPLEAILEQARGANPSIQAQRKSVDLASEAIALARSKDNTTLDFQFDYAHHRLLNVSELSADVYTAQVVFAWDVYDGGRTRYSRNEAREKKQQAEAQLDSVVDDLEIAVRQAHNQYVESRKQLDRNQKNIELAQENLRVVQERVEQSVLLPVDLLEARVNLQKSIVNRDRTLSQLVKGRAKLYQLMGKLQPDIF